jgi:hypothetical protein
MNLLNGLRLRVYACAHIADNDVVVNLHMFPDRTALKRYAMKAVLLFTHTARCSKRVSLCVFEYPKQTLGNVMSRKQAKR